MMVHQLEVCCPVCGGNFRQSGERWDCISCSKSFPVLFGIPDLRIFPDPYIEIEADHAKGLELAAQFERLNFEQLVRYYYSITSVVPRHHADQYTRSVIGAGERAQSSLAEWDLRNGSESFLDIGCGTGPLLVATARKFRNVIGVDIAFRWLVVAKKRLQETGFDLPLLCACAEALPFRKNQFDVVSFDSTLEVLQDQKKGVAEAYRVLQPGGQLFVQTPNRFSLGPDPHLKIWAGGYLPDRWIAAYARRQQAIPPKRKLLTGRSLKQLLKEAGFCSIQLAIPSLGVNQVPRIFKSAVRIYNLARQLPMVRSVLRSVGPLLLASARKPE